MSQRSEHLMMSQRFRVQFSTIRSGEPQLSIASSMTIWYPLLDALGTIRHMNIRTSLFTYAHKHICIQIITQLNKCLKGSCSCLSCTCFNMSMCGHHALAVLWDSRTPSELLFTMFWHEKDWEERRTGLQGGNGGEHSLGRSQLIVSLFISNLEESCKILLGFYVLCFWQITLLCL